MNTSLLIMFVGGPGSGKTTFAKQLSEKIHATVLNSDAIRLSMWGSQKNVWATHSDPEQRAYNNLLTFGAMDYAAAQTLKAGHPVIVDSNANKPAERQKLARIAELQNATPVVVWINTPHELAIERIIARQADSDSHQKNPEDAREIVERFAAEIELPSQGEFFLEISGEIPFEEQYAVFERGIQEPPGSR